jgi:ferrous iron transport protein A
MTTLKDVPVGSRVRVTKINSTGAVRRRIMDMGITKGIDITVTNCAPLGDPIELKLRGYTLSLRRADAEMITVEKTDQ